MKWLMLSCCLTLLFSLRCMAAQGGSGGEGPRVSDAEFFAMLDLGYPGLEKVSVAVKAGDMAAAKHEFADHLRKRTKPRWSFDWRARPKHDARPDKVDTRDADRILQRDLPSVSVYHKYDGEIDWTLNPINYREWPWQLNRHQFWVTLGRAYWATGEERYAQEFVYQMTDWVRKCPVPINDSGNSSETWRTIEAGIRTGHNWPEAYHLFLSSPSFTDDAIVTMVKSFVEHARQLVRWPTTGNWLTMEANGLMHVGVLFPEFRDAADWRQIASSRLYEELDKQVYPDGAQIELSTGYHQVSLLNFVEAWRFAHLNGISMPADYIAKIQRMYDYNLLASMPDGCLPGLNDANRTGIRNSLKEALTFFPSRKDFEWVATSGAEGKMPKVTSVPLAFSGHMIMRSGWKPDDLYMLYDAGPFGYGHQHEDALSMVLYAYGKYMLVDPGNYPYDSSQWRKYVLSTRAHNTIMVDGGEQHRKGRPRAEYVISKPLPIRWSTGDGFDYASSRYNDGYGDKGELKVAHERRVFFVKPEYWVVVDSLTPADDKPHRYESMFHLDFGRAEAGSKSAAVRTLDADSANLTIVPAQGVKATIVSAQEKPIVQGWMPAKAYDVRPLPTAVFAKEQTGPTSMAYVLYPTPKGGACPIASVESLDGGSLAVRFADGRVDYFAAGGGEKLKFGDFETDAEGAYVRVENGKVISALLAGGTGIAQSGKQIKAEIVQVRDLSKTEETHRL